MVLVFLLPMGYEFIRLKLFLGLIIMSAGGWREGGEVSITKEKNTRS